MTCLHAQHPCQCSLLPSGCLPRHRLRRTPPRPRPRPATVAKEASPLAATTKASSPEATTGVFPSTPARSLPDHSGKAHLVVARPPCPRPPPQPATPCPRPPPRPPPLAAPTGHPPRNPLSPSRCRRGRVPQQGPPPYPNGRRRWDGSRADMATAAVGMTAVSSGTDVASTSGAAVDGSMPGRHGCRLVGCPIGERTPLRPPLTWRRPRGVLISAAVPRQASAARPRRSLAATYPHGRLRGAMIPAAVPWRSVAAPSPLIHAATSPHGRPRGALIPRAGRPRLK